MTKLTVEARRDSLGNPTWMRIKKVEVDIDYDPITGAWNKIVFTGRRDRLPKIADLLGLIPVQDIDVYVKTRDETNILIDKLTQTAYTERRSTISNNGATASWSTETGNSRAAKFFPRGCRGFINTIDVYCKDAAAAGGTITVYISPHPSMGYFYSADVTVSAGAVPGWRSATFNKMWNYDSLFIFIVCSVSDIKFGYDSDIPHDNFTSADSGVTWTFSNYRLWFRAVMKGETIGDVPVSGTINTIETPSISSSDEVTAVSVPDVTQTLILTVSGAGTMIEARLTFGTAIAPAADKQYNLFVYADGNLAYDTTNFLLTQSRTATAGRSSCGEFFQDATLTYMLLRLPIKFKRQLRLYAYHNLGAAKNVDGRFLTSKIR